MATRVTRETLNSIRDNNELSVLVADALDIRISSLPAMISRPTRRLTEYPVLEIISNYLGKPIIDLIEEFEEDERDTVDTTNLQKTAQ